MRMALKFCLPCMGDSAADSQRQQAHGKNQRPAGQIQATQRDPLLTQMKNRPVRLVDA